MHVAHLDPRLWQPGGVTTMIALSAAAQRDLGVEVTFVGPPGASARARGDAAAATVEWNDPRRLDRVLSRVGADVVHLHGAPDGAPYDVGVPVVSTVHNHNAYCPSGSKWFSRADAVCPYAPGPVVCTYGHLVKRCGSQRPERVRADLERWRRTAAWLARSDLVLTYSEFVRSHAVAAGAPMTRVRRLEQPVAAVDDVPPPSAVAARVAFLGRIVPAKGLLWLIEALAASDPTVELDVLGEGRDEPRIRTAIAELGLEERVRTHGWVGADERDRLLRGCRAVVVPSLWPEPAGGVALEAMACGRPVIASAVGGLPERVRDAETGILVPAGDRGALSAALDQVVTAPEWLDELGARGRQMTRDRHRPDHHGAALLDLYRSVI